MTNIDLFSFFIFLRLLYLPYIKLLSQWQEQGIKNDNKPLQTEEEHPCCLILELQESSLKSVFHFDFKNSLCSVTDS